MKTTKTFDCVEMKRRGAERVQKELSGMTLEEELAYWQAGTELLKKRQQEVRPASRHNQIAGTPEHIK